MRKNFYYIVIIIIGLVISLVAWIGVTFTENIEAKYWLPRGLKIVEIAGFFMLLMNGSFIKTRYFRIVQGIAALILIGALIKILHWEFYGITGNLILIVSFLGIMIFYFISFLKKPIRKRLDYLKLAWVLTKYSISTLILLHLISWEYDFIPTILIWLAILEYCIQEYKNKRLFE